MSELDRLEGVSRDLRSPPSDSSLSAVRPESLDEFAGQAEAKENLRVFLRAASERGEPLDHVALAGPPGLGKTTLARIVARESGGSLRIASGAALSRAGDLAGVLTSLDDGDVLFIDEIHRMPRAAEEILYSALEDRAIDLMTGEGAGARSVRIGLRAFTAVGATTRLGLLSAPLRDRFGIVLRLDFYSADELTGIVSRAASRLGASATSSGAREIARRSRGTPRVALRLLRRVRDFVEVEESSGRLDAVTASRALSRLGVDDEGLDAFDRRYLATLARSFDGGPAGIESLSAALNETRDSLEEVLEPYLLRAGFVARTPRGRVLSPRGYARLEAAAEGATESLLGKN